MTTNRILLLATAAMLSGCAMTTNKSAASAEELAKCEAMAATMGTANAHSHAESKGTIASTPMNAEHRRCREILADALK